MLACLFFCDSSPQNRAGLDQTSFFAGSRCARPGYDLTYSLCLPVAPLLSHSPPPRPPLFFVSLLTNLPPCIFCCLVSTGCNATIMTMVMMMTCCICSGSRTEQTLARPGYPGSSLFRSNKSDLSKHSTRRLGDRPVSPILVPFCPPRRDLHPSLSLLPIVNNLIDRPIALSLLLVACGWALLENVSRMSNRTELIETRNQLKAMR